MTNARRLLVLSLLVPACGSSAGPPVVDAASTADAARTPDAGATPDAASPPDAAATPDAAAGGGSCEPGCLVSSAKPRQLVAAVPPGALTQVNGNTDFALRLYRVLRADKPDDNLFYSPYSISVALAMTYAGAKGTTATQMAETLKLGPDSHQAFNAVDQELARRAADPVEVGSAFQLSLTNALWGKRDETFQPAFLDVLSVNYGAGMHVLDFAANPEAARATINQWVEDRTVGRIQELVPAGLIDAGTALVLTNAIYFKASWLVSFPEAATAPQPFTLGGGQVINVPTMVATAHRAYAETADLQAVALPYAGGKVSMLVILPRAGRLAAVEDALSVDSLTALVGALQPQEVRLSLPKFSLSSAAFLKAALASMGMPVAFTGNADFSGINGRGQLMIGEVVHKAFLAVDEKGTEAAAATAVVVGPPSVPPEPMVLKIDRPFLFLIRDEPTGAVLFVGRTLDPR